MTPANTPSKKTIYVDVDEEITGVIDKVRSANESIVALVVPKRAAIFLSAVNMKLLKRAADQNDKKVVLITSNQSVLPLAGMVGMHVASNLNSKPYIPSAPEAIESGSADDEEEAIEIDSAVPAAAAVAVGAAAAAAAKDDVPSIDVDNAAVNGSAAASEAKKSAVKVKKDKKPKLKVPNFNKFRTGLIIAIVAVILLAAGGVWAFVFAPSAVVTIKGETQSESLSVAIKADTTATSLDEEASVVPSKTKELKKTESEKVPATGQKDKGNKASGTMTLKNCSKSDGSVNIPAGTGISSGDLTFITQAAVSLEPSEFTGGGSCKSDTKDVSVMAQQAGDKYNVSARSYTVAGFSGVNASGSAMTGGTSQIVKVVSASDVESAKSKINAKQTGATEELKAGLTAEGYIPLVDTFNTVNGNYVAAPAVDTEASEVTVSVQNTYTMVGIKKEDLQKLIANKAVKDAGIDTSKQVVLDDGLSEATYQLGASKGTVTDVTVKTRVVAGPEIDQNALKAEIAGKKRGEAEQILKARPGIKEVRIDTKPFFNYSVPKNVKKITFVVEETDGTQIKP